MSERHIYPDRITKKAVTLARKHGRETDSSRSETGPVVRRADIERFAVEFAGILESGTKSTKAEIFLEGEKIFWATLESGWEDDLDGKLLHWGPRQDWRSDFMALMG